MSTHDTHEDHIMMQDGRVMMMRNGEMMPDGTMRMLEEGETMLLQGQPMGAENMTDKQFKEAMEDEELRDQLH